MPSHTASLNGAASLWGESSQAPDRSRRDRARRGKSRIVGIVFIVALMAGIVINATLLQTGHVAPVVASSDAEPGDMRQAALQPEPPPQPVPIQAAPATAPAPVLASAKPDAVDATPMGSITSSRSPARVKAHARSGPAKLAAKPKTDRIAALLKRLGVLR